MELSPIEHSRQQLRRAWKPDPLPTDPPLSPRGPADLEHRRAWNRRRLASAEAVLMQAPEGRRLLLEGEAEDRRRQAEALEDSRRVIRAAWAGRPLPIAPPAVAPIEDSRRVARSAWLPDGPAAESPLRAAKPQ